MFQNVSGEQLLVLAADPTTREAAVSEAQRRIGKGSKCAGPRAVVAQFAVAEAPVKAKRTRKAKTPKTPVALEIAPEPVLTVEESLAEMLKLARKWANQDAYAYAAEHGSEGEYQRIARRMFAPMLDKHMRQLGLRIDVEV